MDLKLILLKDYLNLKKKYGQLKEEIKTLKLELESNNKTNKVIYIFYGIQCLMKMFINWDVLKILTKG